MRINCVMALAALAGSFAVSSHAHAEFVETVVQSGNDVVATGSGTLNINALQFVLASSAFYDNVVGGQATLLNRPGSAVVVSYSTFGGGWTGPTNFNSAGQPKDATSSTGDVVGIQGLGDFVFVPGGYISGSPLSGSMTFANQTLASLGMGVGTYTFAWGAGANADSFVVNIEAGTVPPPLATPEPSSLALEMLGGIGLGVLGARRRRL